MKSFKKIILALMSVTNIMAANSALAVSPAPTSWELAGQFNHNINNASTLWQYGYKAVGNPSFTHMTVALPAVPSAYKGYRMSTTNFVQVGRNLLAPPLNVMSGPQQITLSAGGLAMHPGNNCETAVVRFKAPTAGLYRASGQFFGIDGNGSATQTRVQIVSNVGNAVTPLFAGTVSVPTTVAQSFTSVTAQLGAGDTLDFEVTCGPSNNFIYGTTGINAVIEKM
jgi:hypothetical protein